MVYYKLLIFVILILINNINYASLFEVKCGDIITLKKNTTCQISLESNPTTGYIWDIVNNTNGVIILKSEFIKNKKRLCGSPTIQRIIFKTSVIGKYLLKIVYHRPWEIDVIKICKVSINIIQ